MSRTCSECKRDLEEGHSRNCSKDLLNRLQASINKRRKRKEQS